MPATVSVATGAISVSVPVTGVACGIGHDHGQRAGPGQRDRLGDRRTGGGWGHPVTRQRDGPMSGNTVSFPVTLGTGAPAGGVSITLASSNTSIATVWPSQRLHSGGRNERTRVDHCHWRKRRVRNHYRVGLRLSNRQCTGAGHRAALPQTTMSFSPASLTINGTATQNLTTEFVFARASHADGHPYQQ